MGIFKQIEQQVMACQSFDAVMERAKGWPRCMVQHNELLKASFQGGKPKMWCKTRAVKWRFFKGSTWQFLLWIQLDYFLRHIISEFLEFDFGHPFTVELSDLPRLAIPQAAGAAARPRRCHGQHRTRRRGAREASGSAAGAKSEVADGQRAMFLVRSAMNYDRLTTRYT